MSENKTLQQLTLFAADSPARTCPLPEGGRAWMESGADCGSNLHELLANLSRSGWLSKMCPAFYPAAEGEILPSSFEGWSNAGMACAGGCLTLSFSESPSAVAACSLSDILETDVPQRYSLSATAARGILRRAVNRKKTLPLPLQRALQVTADALPETIADRTT